MGTAIQTFANEVTDATEGRVSFQIFPNGQLGSLATVIEAVDLGEIAISMSDISLITETVPQLNLLALPMIVKDFDGWKALVNSEVGEELANILAENSNMYMMGYVFNGFREVIVKKDIQSLEDCTGIILRSPEADIYVQTFQRMNFTPTPLDAAEVYNGLNAGVVDGADTSFEGFWNNSYYEVATRIIESNHMAATMTIIMNQEIWDTIPAEDQAIVAEVYDRVFDQCSEDVYAASMGFKQKLLDAGCTIYQYTAEEQAVLVERFQSYWDESASANGFEDLLAKAIEIRG